METQTTTDCEQAARAMMAGGLTPSERDELTLRDKSVPDNVAEARAIHALSCTHEQTDPRIAYAFRALGALWEAGQEAEVIVTNGTDSEAVVEPDQVVGLLFGDDASLMVLDGTERERTGDERWARTAWDDEIDIRVTTVESLLDVLLDGEDDE